jgi:hypothetical protein
MKIYKVLQLGLQLGFPIAMDTCSSWYFITLSVIKQVATIAMDTLCRIQYHIYSATHMQLDATSLQLISILDSHTYSNVANEMPTWHFIHSLMNDIVNNCMIIDFSSTKQLNCNLQCNYPNFTQPLSCCFNYNR